MANDANEPLSTTSFSSPVVIGCFARLCQAAHARQVLKHQRSRRQHSLRWLSCTRASTKSAQSGCRPGHWLAHGVSPGLTSCRTFLRWPSAVHLACSCTTSAGVTSPTALSDENDLSRDRHAKNLDRQLANNTAAALGDTGHVGIAMSPLVSPICITPLPSVLVDQGGYVPDFEVHRNTTVWRVERGCKSSASVTGVLGYD